MVILDEKENWPCQGNTYLMSNTIYVFMENKKIFYLEAGLGGSVGCVSNW